MNDLTANETQVMCPVMLSLNTFIRKGMNQFIASKSESLLNAITL